MTDPIIPRCSTDLSQIRALFVNDTALHTMGRIEQIWENVLGGPQLAGQPFHVPLRTGFVDVPQVPTGYEFTVGLTVYGTYYQDLPGFHENWRDLARLVWNPKTPLTIKRVLDFGSGAESHTCRARYISGLSPDMIMPSIGRMALTFYNLDGYWYGLNAVPYTLNGTSGTMTIGGDAVTRRMTMTFSGGTNQVLTNTTTGTSVTYTGSTSTAVIMQNETFTATQSSTNVVGNVTHSGDTFWMTLAPGNNSLTLSGGGQVAISANEAFL